MELRLQYVLLVLLMTVNGTQTTFVQNTYRKLKPGQNITGIMGIELTAESNIECSSK